MAFFVYSSYTLKKKITSIKQDSVNLTQYSHYRENLKILRHPSKLKKKKTGSVQVTYLLNLYFFISSCLLWEFTPMHTNMLNFV